MWGLSYPYLAKNPQRPYLTHNILLFIPKFYIETVLLPHENNRIKEGPLFFGDLLWFIVLCILIISNTGYNRRYVFEEVYWYIDDKEVRMGWFDVEFQFECGIGRLSHWFVSMVLLHIIRRRIVWLWTICWLLIIVVALYWILMD